jgi:hypothetical protein
MVRELIKKALKSDIVRTSFLSASVSALAAVSVSRWGLPFIEKNEMKLNLHNWSRKARRQI